MHNELGERSRYVLILCICEAADEILTSRHIFLLILSIPKRHRLTTKASPVTQPCLLCPLRGQLNRQRSIYSLLLCYKICQQKDEVPYIPTKEKTVDSAWTFGEFAVDCNQPSILAACCIREAYGKSGEE